MNFLEKMISNPDYGSRAGAPIVSLAFGLAFLFFASQVLSTGSIRLSKAGAGRFIHFSDHPITFVLVCVLAAAGGILGLLNARQRYLMHDE